MGEQCGSYKDNQSTVQHFFSYDQFAQTALRTPLPCRSATPRLRRTVNYSKGFLTSRVCRSLYCIESLSEFLLVYNPIAPELVEMPRKIIRTKSEKTSLLTPSPETAQRTSTGIRAHSKYSSRKRTARNGKKREAGGPNDQWRETSKAASSDCQPADRLSCTSGTMTTVSGIPQSIKARRHSTRVSWTISRG